MENFTDPPSHIFNFFVDPVAVSCGSPPFYPWVTATDPPPHIFLFFSHSAPSQDLKWNIP